MKNLIRHLALLILPLCGMAESAHATFANQNYASQSHGIGLSGNLSYSRQSDGTGNRQDSQLGKSLGGEQRNDSVHNTAYASLNTANLIIRDAQAQEALTGQPVGALLTEANRGIYTDTGAENSGATPAALKGENTLGQLQQEAQAAEYIDQNRQSIKQQLRETQNTLQEAYASGQISAADYAAQQSELSRQQQLTDALANILLADNAGEAALGAYMPYAAAQIKAHTASGSAGNLVLHSLLGAGNALANGGNSEAALRGALAAGGAEAAIPLLAQTLYGTSDAGQLSGAQKGNLSILAGLLGAGIGGSGGDASGIVSGSRAAENAVDNNYLFRAEAEEFHRLQQERAQCAQTGGNCDAIANRLAELYELNQKRDRDLALACSGGLSQNCASEIVTLTSAYHSYGDSHAIIRNPGLSAKYMDVAIKYGDAQHQYMETVGKEALVTLASESIEGSVELAMLTGQAMLGDSEAREQLHQIGQAIKELAKSPIEVTSTAIKAQLAEADRLEALGHTREADVLRAKLYISGQLGIASAPGMAKLTATITKTVAQGTKQAGKALTGKLDEALARGWDGRLDDYTYNPADGTFNGPRGGKLINTGAENLGNSVYQRINPDGSAGDYLMIVATDNGFRQVNTTKPDALKQHNTDENISPSGLHRPSLRAETMRKIEELTGFQKQPDGSYFNERKDILIK